MLTIVLFCELIYTSLNLIKSIRNVGGYYLEYTTNQIMSLIDHTNLFSYATESDIKRLIDEASKFSTYAVCINPVHRKFARDYILSKKLPVKLSVVVDFPFGALETSDRVDLIQKFGRSVDELDIVIQVGKIKEGNLESVKRDVEAIVAAAHKVGKVIKIITEDPHLTAQEKESIYDIICASEADFIKTATTFDNKEYTSLLKNQSGAQPENIKLMAERSKALGSKIGIKASGGVRTYEQIKNLLSLAERAPHPDSFRVGCSRTASIYEETIKLGPTTN